MADAFGSGHMSMRDHHVILPARPQSARQSRGGHRGRAWRPAGNGNSQQVDFGSMKVVDATDFPHGHQEAQAARSRESSVVRRQEREESVHGHGLKDSSEALTGLMMAVLNVYESRTSTDLWSKLLEPVRSLVPCEEVKVVVHSRRAPPAEAPASGPFDPTLRHRMRAVTFVEQWDQRRIEGAAALTQRICRIPSTDAERYHWDQYEVVRSQAGGFRCLLAVPLFDGDGNVLAVLKLRNRVSNPGGQPFFEFQRSDFPTLSAFAAIFAAIVPHPYLGHLGGQTPCRPKARMELTDGGIRAVVSWRLPKELRGGVVQELAYGEVRHEDEFHRQSPPPHWCVLPCGLLDPVGLTDDEEPLFEFTVPHLSAGTAYAFSLRIRNLHLTAEWSEPSAKLMTYLAAPHSLTNHTVQLLPLSDNAVRLEWEKLETCDPGLRLVEYRLVACSAGDGKAASLEPSGIATMKPQDEQVVGVFISDGSLPIESALVSHLQTNVVYSFAVEARYAYVGSRSFTRVLVSEPFTFPTVDLTLPPPQPVSADVAPPGAADRELKAGQVTLQWPYPSDVSQQLALQYRTAWPTGHSGGCPRLSVSTWTMLRAGDCIAAQLVFATGAEEVRLVDRGDFDSQLAVQFRVVTLPQWGSSSPPSAWFHPAPPPCPELLQSGFVCNDEEGIALVVGWHSRHDRIMDLEARHLGDLGPIGYAVHYDFSRGNGRTPTRFQVRFRAAAEDGNPRGDWQDLPQQLVPAPDVMDGGHLVERGGAVNPRHQQEAVTRHTWRIHEKAWMSTPQQWAVEVELRVGNALFWSPWAAAGLTSLKIKAPIAAAAGLKLEDIRGESVRLAWTACQPQEPGLKALEYRILCLELPDNSDVRIESGGRIIAWRTIDSLVVETEVTTNDTRDVPAGSQQQQHYTVRSLLPQKRYTFAVECRYARLPPSLAATATVRLEAQKPLAARGTKLGPIAGAPEVRLQLLASAGLALGMSWHMKLSAGAAVPPSLCYQVAETTQQVEFPAGLLMESKGGKEVAMKTDGRFAVDTSGEVVTAEVSIASAAVEAALGSVQTQPTGKFAVRVGDPATGVWTDWSRPSSAINLALPPPVPRSVGKSGNLTGISAGLEVRREAASSAGSASGQRIEGVRLGWQSFGPHQSTPKELHCNLTVRYEVIVWCLAAGKTSFEEARAALLRRSAPPAADVLPVFRSEVAAAKPPGGDATETHSFVVSGEHLQPLKYHIFQVVASYDTAKGQRLQVLPADASLLSGLSSAAVSQEPFLPTLQKPAAPVVSRMAGQCAEAPDQAVVLTLPAEIQETAKLEQVFIEYREGSLPPQQQGATHHDLEASVDTVVPSSGWVTAATDSVQAIPGSRDHQVLVRGLPATPCQFRIRQGSTTSEASAWAEPSVWCPEALAVKDYPLQLGEASSMSLSGLCAALGIGADGSLSARLLWPRGPVRGVLAPLERYQVRFRYATPGAAWSELPASDLPPVSGGAVAAPCCQCSISRELRPGVQYEFSLRLSNSLGRWSPWTQATPPLAMVLPTLVPGNTSGENCLRITGATASAVLLAWKPFCVARRGDEGSCASPLLVDEVAEVPGTLMADYELLIMDEQGNTAGMLQREGIVFFEEVATKSRAAWLEAEVILEANRTYVFEVRARFRTGSWGPSLTSEAVPPRLLPISVASFTADLVVEECKEGVSAGIHFDCSVAGFAGGGPSAAQEDKGARRSPIEQKAAAMTMYQLRCAAVMDTAAEAAAPGALASVWQEWPAMDASPSYFAPARSLSSTLWLPQAAVLLWPGEQYLFCVRCSDEYGRWTEWSSPSDIISLNAPALTPPKAEKAASGSQSSCMKLTPLSARSVRVEWSSFRPCGDNTAAHSGLNAALQRIAYRLSGFRRPPKSADWQSMGEPLCEFVTERRASASSGLAHEVTGLDDKYEYVFKLTARWVDLPMTIGNADWVQEVSSPVHYQPREVQLRDPPQAEVVASDLQGVGVVLRWFPNRHLRDARGVPVEGAKYQVRYQRAQPVSLSSSGARTSATGAVPSLQSGNEPWHTQPAVLEEMDETTPDQGSCRVGSLSVGSMYRFSIRVGDASHWSSWSPATAPVLIAVPPPVPQQGDRLQVVAGRLEWRPFSTTSGLASLEYKVSALEYPSNPSPRFGVDDNQCRLCSMGYAKAEADGSAVSLPKKVSWEIQGLQRGMQYRFFVCARYAALPLGAMAAPATCIPGSSATTLSAWPTEVAEALEHVDSVSWEAALNTVGLWSEVVNTALFPETALSNLRGSDC